MPIVFGILSNNGLVKLSSVAEIKIRGLKQNLKRNFKIKITAKFK